MVLQPSFAKKLNTEGFSPLHLAVQNHQSELAKELIMFDSTLVRIPGRGGMTPLHHVSIRDTNLNGETAFQITVMNDKYKELKILRGWVQRLHNSDSSSTENYVLNKCNREGNTALHLAADKNNHQACSKISVGVHVTEPKSGMTALDALRVNGHLMNRENDKKMQVNLYLLAPLTCASPDCIRSCPMPTCILHEVEADYTEEIPKLRNDLNSVDIQSIV
ncbi:hypothetical protein YC2023_117946 [Brassica napus]